jgi:hypothetical protein
MVAINLEEYAQLFLEKQVDGNKLDKLNDRGLQVTLLIIILLWNKFLYDFMVY